MSNIVEHFSIYGSLFNCAVQEFDIVIKNTLNKLIIIRYVDKKRLNVDINYAVMFDKNYIDRFNKCIICLQHLTYTKGLIICHNCCNICIGKKVMVNIGMFEVSTSMMINFDIFELYTIMMYEDYQMISFSDYNKHFVDHRSSFPNGTKRNVLNYFVNNSPKLKDRFYHMVPVILLLSLSDLASECCVLNDDIMFYILKFIY